MTNSANLRTTNRKPMSGQQFQSNKANLVLLILFTLAVFARQEASAWRLFDFSSAESSAARSLYGSPLQAPLAGFNPTLTSQLLVPMSAAGSQNQIQMQQPANEPLRPAPMPVQAQPQAQPQQQQPQPLPSFASLVAPAAGQLIQSAVEQALNLSAAPDGNQKVDSRDASSIGAQQARGEQPKQSAEQHQPQKTGSGELEAKASLGSPAGKILEALAAASTGSGPSSNLTATVADKVVGHLLKPRNKSSPALSKASQMEQQIINQHARVHSFQKLAPSKQRDTKIASYLDSSSFGGSSSSSSGNQQRDSSALAAILNNLKLSGFSNRNSIVKAISDNKLSRSK